MNFKDLKLGFRKGPPSLQVTRRDHFLERNLSYYLPNFHIMISDLMNSITDLNSNFVSDYSIIAVQ